jgi:hypothetical protein
MNLKASKDGAPGGTWQIEYNSQTQKMTGTWSDGQVSQRFDLMAHDFKYNPKLGLNADDNTIEANQNAPTTWQPDPSLVRYTQATCHDNSERGEGSGLTRPEIRYLRNLILARHGKAFSTLEVRAQFEEDSLFTKDESRKGWYVPVHQDIDQNELTDIEKNNLKIMQQCEPNAPAELKTYWG